MYRNISYGKCDAKELNHLCGLLDQIQEHAGISRHGALAWLLLFGARETAGLSWGDAGVTGNNMMQDTVKIILTYPAEKTEGFLYFIKVKEDDLFKVGHTRKSPLRRLPMIQTGCPYEIELHMAVHFRDCHKKEREFHGLLAQYNTHGEWYEIDTRAIEELVTQEIVREHIASVNTVSDTILPSHVVSEIERRLASIGLGTGIDIGTDIERTQ